MPWHAHGVRVLPGRSESSSVDPIQIACLIALESQPLSIRRISDLTSLPRPRATRALAALRDLRLVRVTQAASGRKHIHILTEEGRMMAALAKSFENDVAAILDRTRTTRADSRVGGFA